MTLLTLPPRTLNMTAASLDDIDEQTITAPTVGDYGRWIGIVRDRYGDRLNLGPTHAPYWQPEAQIRAHFAGSAYTTALATFVATITNGPLGDVSWELMVEESLKLARRANDLRWDFQLRNLSDVRAPVGAIATIWKGIVRPQQHVTITAD